MKKPLAMNEAMEHKGISRKTFLIYLLQFSLFGAVVEVIGVE